MPKQKRDLHPWIALACMVILLTGCQGLAFSAEGAALNQISQGSMPEFSIEPGSARVLQNVEVGDTRVVLVEFRGVSAKIGPQNCLFEYQAIRRFGGWATSGGGGSCSNEQLDPQQQLTVGSSINGGDGVTDPGMSSVGGLVLNDAISKVIVTWSDGQEQEASLANHTYLAARQDQIEYSKIEAFDSEGNLVFNLEQPAPPPGKQ
jgi:hypothetical protein